MVGSMLKQLGIKTRSGSVEESCLGSFAAN